jgi:hypothetical protein
MENGEDFFVRYYDGQSYITLATLVSRLHFKNEFYWVATVTITTAEVNFAPNARFRFQCDASDDDDDIYIDAVTLTGFTDTAHTRGVTVERVAKNIGQQANLIDDRVSDLIILPNPATNYIRIQSDVPVDELRIISSQGIDVQSFETNMQLQEVDLAKIPAGMYILMVRSGDIWTPVKFVKL